MYNEINKILQHCYKRGYRQWVHVYASIFVIMYVSVRACTPFLCTSACVHGRAFDPA